MPHVIKVTGGPTYRNADGSIRRAERGQPEEVSDAQADKMVRSGDYERASLESVETNFKVETDEKE